MLKLAGAMRFPQREDSDLWRQRQYRTGCNGLSEIICGRRSRAAWDTDVRPKKEEDEIDATTLIKSIMIFNSSRNP